MLTKVAIWYLRKRNVSVLIGFLLKGGAIQQDNEKAYLYDNWNNKTSYYTKSGIKIKIPEGKFKI